MAEETNRSLLSRLLARGLAHVGDEIVRRTNGGKEETQGNAQGNAQEGNAQGNAQEGNAQEVVETEGVEVP